MREHLIDLLDQALERLVIEKVLTSKPEIRPQITPSKDKQHGDYATNIALMLSKQVGSPPNELARHIIAAIPRSPYIQRLEIAGPGFINFFLDASCFQHIIAEILKQGNQYGESQIGAGRRIHIEFVSANPTGPLHVGHGRGAAYGATVSNLLKAVGFQVHREYYVNDVGRQMGILALSVWIRYLQQCGETLELPKNAYQGEYIVAIAHQLLSQYGERFRHPSASILTLLPTLLNLNEQPEEYLDAYIEASKTLLGNDYKIVFNVGLETILSDIKEDLEEFGVIFDEWFREHTLMEKGLVQKGIELLTEKDYVYEKNDALWFRATSLGDEKDRVLIRSNGVSTYFASDVAYHLYKYQKGYDRMINIFGADHHGYIARIKAFLEGLGEDPRKLTILLVQFAILYRGKERISMSTRGGTFVTLRQLRNEVGNDAARFFYVMRKPEQHLDFDLELAKSKSSENPVYYIQYAHARICSVFRQLQLMTHEWDKTEGLTHLEQLNSSHEKELQKKLAQYSSIVSTAALSYEPHTLAHYLQELAHHFHTYYNAEKFLVENSALRNARLTLIAATQQIIKNGLELLGVSAPQEM